MEDHTWETEEPLSTNSDTMNDFINNRMGIVLGVDWRITYRDGTYAQAKNNKGGHLEIHASGNGNFTSHRVRFETLP